MREVVAFLDANVLAAPVTRTLVTAGAIPVEIVTVWSAAAEAEADSHLPPRASKVADVRREKLGFSLSPTAKSTAGLRTIPVGDRQIIADAVAAEATYLITTDVDDFAIEDLRRHRMSAVNPDYFMALRYTEHAYRAGIRVLAEMMKNPPRTAEEIHSALGKQHPQLLRRFADVFDSAPAPASNKPPQVIFRGVRCIQCAANLNTDEQLRVGLCVEHLVA